MLVGSQTQLD